MVMTLCDIEDMIMVWWWFQLVFTGLMISIYTGTWDHAVRGSADHAERKVSWNSNQATLIHLDKVVLLKTAIWLTTIKFILRAQFYLCWILDLRTSEAPRSALRSQSSWGSQRRSVTAKSRGKIFWSKFERREGEKWREGSATSGWVASSNAQNILGMGIGGEEKEIRIKYLQM